MGTQSRVGGGQDTHGELVEVRDRVLSGHVDVVATQVVPHVGGRVEYRLAVRAQRSPVMVGGDGILVA